MRGVVLERGQVLVRDDLPPPQPRTGWSRVRVLRAGLCATDQALARGYMGFTGVPGHEFCGIALDGPHAGRRVVGEINAACGRCATCVGGNPRHCPQRTVLGIAGLGGAFAEELALPHENLFPVPDAVSTDAATFTEPLAAALHLADDIDVRACHRALVAGDGKLGILCAWALHLQGVPVTVAGRHATRAQLLPPGAALVEGLLEHEVQPARSFDLAVDATGNPEALSRLLRHVQPRGTIVIKTTTEHPVTLDLAPLVVDELRVVGSRCGPFGAALETLAKHKVPVERLVAARFPLADASEAFARASTRGTLKVLLDVATG